jgi:hypothetical protein
MSREGDAVFASGGWPNRLDDDFFGVEKPLHSLAELFRRDAGCLRCLAKTVGVGIAGAEKANECRPS